MIMIMIMLPCYSTEPLGLSYPWPSHWGPTSPRQPSAPACPGGRPRGRGGRWRGPTSPPGQCPGGRAGGGSGGGWPGHCTSGQGWQCRTGNCPGCTREPCMLHTYIKIYKISILYIISILYQLYLIAYGPSSFTGESGKKRRQSLLLISGLGTPST